MKKVLFFLLMPLTVCSQAELSPGVRQALYGSERSSKPLEIWVQFSNQLDYNLLSEEFDQKNLTNHQRRNEVWRKLHQQHEQTESWLRDFVNTYLLGTAASHHYWINNSAVITLQPQDLKILANQSHVAWIELSTERVIAVEDVVELNEGTSDDNKEAVNGHEPGLDVINAPAMWARGYSGKGRLALILDTGVWPEHPALDKRWKGYRAPLKESWFGYDSKYPQDKPGTHGTHVTGTILGLDRSTNDTIGVAFDAQFISDDHVVSNHDEIKPLHSITPAFQWAFDPDGDTSTYFDVPDVINNSWGHEFDTSEYICINPIGDAIAACQLGGTAVVWSAGNNGPNGKTIGSPATITRNPYLVFTVGAIDPHRAGYPIAGFSSRGPSHCIDTGILAIKPEVVAPGVNIRSAVDADGYGNYQGTSMAGPHVAGAVLLLKEAFPNLPGEKLLEALAKSAHDLGTAGEDNVYGNGLIDVDSAFLWLSQSHTPVTPPKYENDIVLDFEGFKNENITCGLDNEASLIIRNSGNKVLLAADVQLVVESFGGSKQTLLLTNDLAPGDSIKFSPVISFNPNGNSGFKARIELATGYDDAVWNNQIVSEWLSLFYANLPFTDNFENGLNNWVVENPDRDYSWRVKMLGDSGIEKGSAQLPFAGMSTRTSQKDILYSPKLNTAGFKNLKLIYDYAYTTKSVEILSDTFNIYVAEGCDLTKWTRVGHYWGNDLLTVPTQSPYYWPEDKDWKSNNIDLSAFENAQELVIKFEGVNSYGNNLYLDNIVVTGDNFTGFKEVVSQHNVRIFPNPATDKVMVSGELGPYTHWTVFSSIGQVMLRGNALEKQELEIDIQTLPTGTYILELSGESIFRDQLIVE